jgi:rubredoxin
MERYICDVCGFIQERDEQTDLKRVENGILSFSCSICQGKLISEEQMKEKEEIARLTDEDTKDDYLTPEQDAEEAVIEFLTLAMQKNLREVGNDRTYQFIEDITKAETRAKHRKFFILAGGYIPLCEPIIIK